MNYYFNPPFLKNKKKVFSLSGKKSILKIFILKSLLCLTAVAPSFSAEADLSWFLSQEKSVHKWALIPSYKRTGALGHVLSGRVFVYPVKKKGLYLSLSSDWPFQKEDALAVSANVIYWQEGGGEFSIKGQWGKFFDPYYYKQGSKVRMESPVQKQWIKSYYIRPQFENFSAGVLFEIQQRKEKGGPCFLYKEGKKAEKKNESCLLFSPHELAGAFGVIARSDTRDNIFNPKKGRLFRADLKTGYEWAGSKILFLQMEAQAKYIYSILEDERWMLNLALGWTLWNRAGKGGLFPYSYQFKLGGPDRLRGYQESRFHSDQYYLIQGELRWPFNSWLQPLMFVDMGNISFKKRPKTTFGFGVRVGLPPSYEQRIRIEQGFAADQSNFVVTFARPY